MSQSISPHHLPRPAQNAAYLAVLAAPPLINLAISINCFNHFRAISKHQLPINHWIFGLLEFVLMGILALLAVNLLRTLLLGHRQIRKTLLAFGVLSTLNLPLSIVTIAGGHLLLQNWLILSVAGGGWALLLS
jgi:hypothetical protein